MSNDQTTILVPLRYPLTADTTRTLAVARRLATDHAPAALTVLHVNLLQNKETIPTEEFKHAICAHLDDVDATVLTRRGFLVEEIILEEIALMAPDIVVVGANKQASWRKRLRRVLWDEPAVGPFLREHAPEDTEIVEADTATESPTGQIA